MGQVLIGTNLICCGLSIHQVVKTALRHLRRLSLASVRVGPLHIERTTTTRRTISQNEEPSPGDSGSESLLTANLEREVSFGLVCVNGDGTPMHAVAARR